MCHVSHIPNWNYLSIFEITDFRNWKGMFQITLVDKNYTIALPIACTLCSIYQPTQFAHRLEIIWGSKDFGITLYIYSCERVVAGGWWLWTKLFHFQADICYGLCTLAAIAAATSDCGAIRWHNRGQQKLQVHTSRDCCCPPIGFSQSRVRDCSAICGRFRIGQKDCPIMGKCNICSTISLAAVLNRCRKSNPSKLRPYRTAKARAARLGRKWRNILCRNRSSQPLSPLVCIDH